jgi:hypothetical protein
LSESKAGKKQDINHTNNNSSSSNSSSIYNNRNNNIKNVGVQQQPLLQFNQPAQGISENK